MVYSSVRGAGLAFAAVLLLGAASAAQAQPPAAQARLMARRAATVDGYRQLLERVKGLQLNSQTYVRDFVAESDVIATDLDNFIKGARIIDTRYYDDDTCEVDVEVDIESLERELRRIVKERYVLFKGWQPYRTEIHVTEYYTQRTIYVTGSSALRAVAPAPTYEPQYAPSQPGTMPRGAMRHPDWDGVSAQQKLMAKRGAQVDAYRQLLERVKGLRLNSQTYVRDFVAESDTIATELNDFIRGTRVVSTRYVAGPICEVEVEVDIQHFEKEFRRMVERHRRHEHVTVSIRDLYHQKTISAVGMAVPGGNPAPRAAAPAPVSSVPDWVGQTIVATGYGLPPDEAESPEQARLLAERAAEIDAKRQLLEQIGGVQVSSSSYVRDFVAQSDEVRAGVDGVIRGARRIDTRYTDDGTVEVDVEVPLNEVWTLVRSRI